MTRKYYSHRAGINPNSDGLPLEDIIGLFLDMFESLESDDYFDEAFGFWCEDRNEIIEGKIKNIDNTILIDIGKKGLWSIGSSARNYTEDDLLDMIEFLYQHVSKPAGVVSHSHQAGSFSMMTYVCNHWDTFDKEEGQKIFREQINFILEKYKTKFELSETGEILHSPEQGFENIFNADIPIDDNNVTEKMNTAKAKFLKYKASINERQSAVRDLADVLEYLKQKMKNTLTKQDESDLFNIANNFGIRHHNDKQKTSYDKNIWLSWMFYHYLSTIHVVLRTIERDKKQKLPL